MEQEKQSKAQVLYFKILEVANRFLRNAKQFEVHILQGHNPSYEELAKIMKTIAGVVHELTDDVDPMFAYQALEYAMIMEKMALAITQGKQEQLDELTEQLDKKPFI